MHSFIIDQNTSQIFAQSLQPLGFEGLAALFKHIYGPADGRNKLGIPLVRAWNHKAVTLTLKGLPGGKGLEKGPMAVDTLPKFLNIGPSQGNEMSFRILPEVHNPSPSLIILTLFAKKNFPRFP
jgi:hypothetical protein